MISIDDENQCGKSPNTELFLVRIFLYSDLIQENTNQEKLCIWTLFTQGSQPVQIFQMSFLPKYKAFPGEIGFLAFLIIKFTFWVGNWEQKL